MSKASALILKGTLKAFKKKFDASEYGGAPLLGISKPVIKAHGSSDAKAVKNITGISLIFSICFNAFCGFSHTCGS